MYQKMNYILILLLFCTNLSFAQDLKFTAAVSSAQVATGEQFEVQFAVNGNGDRFTPPSFEGFQVLSGPNVSNSMTSINGNTTISIAYSYILAAIKEGSITIGSASMTVNGKRLQTNPIRMTVVKGQPVQQNQGRNAADNTITDGSTADLSKSLFLRAVADQTTVYQGQQLLLSYRLYTRVGIVDSRLDKLPDLTGFWSQDVKENQQQAQWRVETYKGQKYNVADVRQSILFPEHSGDIKIAPFEMTFIARVAEPSNDIMDQFFGSPYKDVKHNTKSAPLVIHVKPLPESGKPAGFTGAVGKFSMTADLDKTELKANESLTYKVRVTGSGNIKLLKDLSVNFPPDFEKYDPRITDTVTETAKGVSGSRLYTFLVIPRHQGEYTIDPVQFSYFNPSTGKYVVLSGSPFKVKVNKGTAESNVTAFAAAGKEEVKVLDKDIRYIKTGDAGLSDIGKGFYKSFWYFLLLAAGPASCVAAFIYRNKQRIANSDVVKMRSRKAGRVAARHLASAEKHLGDRNEFYEAVFKGLYGYLSDKLNISVAELNRENIADELNVRKLDPMLTAELLTTLDTCEMARYSPVTSMSEQEILQKSKNIINRIEDEI